MEGWKFGKTTGLNFSVKRCERKKVVLLFFMTVTVLFSLLMSVKIIPAMFEGSN